MSLGEVLFTTACDWRVSDLLVVFELGIVFLGLSAAVFGGWLERAGPRKAGVVAAFCWGGGFLIGAYAVYIHQLWLLWLGARRHRRHRPWPWLYFAGVHADQMVSRTGAAWRPAWPSWALAAAR